MPKDLQKFFLFCKLSAFWEIFQLLTILFNTKSSNLFL